MTDLKRVINLAENFGLIIKKDQDGFSIGHEDQEVAQAPFNHVRTETELAAYVSGWQDAYRHGRASYNEG